jgi:hypothetical protein
MTNEQRAHDLACAVVAGMTSKNQDVDVFEIYDQVYQASLKHFNGK